MDWKLRMALSMLVAALPEKKVKAASLDKVLEPLDAIRQTVDMAENKDHTIDVRDLLSAVVQGIK